MTITTWFLRVTSGFWALLAFQKDQEWQGESRGGSGFGRSCWEPGSPVLSPTQAPSWDHSQAKVGQQEASSSQRSPLFLFQKDTFPQMLGTTMNLNSSAKIVLSQVSTIPATKLKTIKRMNLLCNSGQLDSSSAAIAEFLHDLEPAKFFTDAYRSRPVYFVYPTWSCQMNLPATTARWVLEPRPEKVLSIHKNFPKAWQHCKLMLLTRWCCCA